MPTYLRKTDPCYQNRCSLPHSRAAIISGILSQLRVPYIVLSHFIKKSHAEQIGSENQEVLTEDCIFNHELLEHSLRTHYIVDTELSVGVLFILQLVKQSMTKNEKKPLFSKSYPQTAILVASSELEPMPTVCIHLGWLPYSAWHGHR